MQRDLLVITERSISASQGGFLTYRMVLPARVAADVFPLENRGLRIWWAEKLSGSAYLRGYLGDCRLYTKYSRAGERQLVAVGEAATSAYVYRRNPTCPLKGIVDTDAGNSRWQVIQLDRQQARLLLDRSKEASPIVLSLEDAARVNRRALDGYWPQNLTGVKNPRWLWRMFKRSASLSELVRVSGLDPYETSVVAALRDVGAALSPKAVLQSIYIGSEWMQRYAHLRESTRIEAPPLMPWGWAACSIGPEHVLRSAVGVKVSSVSTEHEVIVATLASSLASMGLKPYLSPLVDLAILYNGSALFFEVKTVERGNLLDQVRAAIGQLLEYRFIYKKVFDSIHLALVAPALGSPSELSFARDFVKDCGIDWVYWLPSISEFRLLQAPLNRLICPM